jgi:hypothetical protein
MILVFLWLVSTYKEDICRKYFNVVPPRPAVAGAEWSTIERLDMTVTSIVMNDIRVWRQGKLTFALNCERQPVVLEPGLTAIIGLSGVGKSTLFDTLAGNMTSYHVLDALINYSVDGTEYSNKKYSHFFRKYGHRIGCKSPSAAFIICILIYLVTLN